MAIPGWQEILLPLLTLAQDGSEYELSFCKVSLADFFQLTRNERTELLPSGKHRVFDNRVEWAKAYLVRAKLLESTGHGKFRIAERGSAILGIEPKQLNLKFLSLFEEVRQFINPQIEKVFISHGQDTLPFCQEIVRGLKVQNMDVWYDENNLNMGHIMEKIEQELMGRQHFVLILSPQAVDSQWVRQEYAAALDLLRTGDLKTFIPVLALSCDIPLFIKNFRIVSENNLSQISSQEAYKQIVQIISESRRR